MRKKRYCLTCASGVFKCGGRCRRYESLPAALLLILQSQSQTPTAKAKSQQPKRSTKSQRQQPEPKPAPKPKPKQTQKQTQQRKPQPKPTPTAIPRISPQRIVPRLSSPEDSPQNILPEDEWMDGWLEGWSGNFSLTATAPNCLLEAFGLHIHVKSIKLNASQCTSTTRRCGCVLGDFLSYWIWLLGGCQSSLKTRNYL